ncbi:MAG: hypothetical protein PHR68_03320 [Candidatus Gracilibacteria bacterium]|nr:hypothetical protein [Candidatus Gracilibacteria bacterium]
MEKTGISAKENKGKFNIKTALDLLKNKSFLNYFIDFIKENDDDILGTFCLEKRKIINFLKNINSKNDTEIFSFFSDFFNNEVIVAVFITTLELEFKDEKEFQKIADTLDYIINLSKSIEKYEINLLVEKMKTEVSQIIMQEIKNPYIKLKKLGFNNFPEDLDIKEVRENDNIIINKINYVKIILSNKKEMYLGDNGEILRIEETGLIISKILYTINGKFEKYLKIVDETNKEYVIINNKTPYLIEGMKEKIKDISKRKIGDFVFFEMVTEENKTMIFDENGVFIDLNYIVTKLLKGGFKSENIDNSTYVLEVKDIVKIYKFGNTKFVKILVDEKFLENYGIHTDKNIEMIISEQGKTLMDEEGNYIKNLYEIKNFQGKDFIGFSASDFGINGYIDKNGKILEDGGKNIFHISKTPSSNINGNIFLNIQKLESKGQFITWDKLKKILDKYEGFDEKSKMLILGEKDNLKIDGENVKSIEIKLKGNEAFFTIEFSTGNKENLTYKELIQKNKEIISNPFMKKINKTIAKM